MATKKKTTTKTEKNTPSKITRGKITPTKTPKVRAEVVESGPTKSDALWDKIKGLELELWGLPAQTLENNAKRYNMSPDAVYLELKSSAVQTALEEALVKVKVGQNEMIDVSKADKYLVISIIPKLFTPSFVQRIN